MKKLCAVIIVFVAWISLCGFVPENNHKYFTIHYENKRIVVSEKTLKPQWFNTESYNDFTKGKTIYQRAEIAKNIEKDFPEIQQIINKIEREVELKPFNGNVNFDPASKPKFWVTNAYCGKELEKDSLSKEILAALKNKRHEDIIIKTKEIPHMKEKQLLDKIGMRSQYSTRFDSGNLSRSSNISRAASCFNGLALMPGEVLSFNRTTGPRTAARGYEEAKIIIDGEFVPGIGGGVCQTSTTLFNATLLSGLTVVESHNHSLPITYVSPGRDAMVSSAVDLVIKNDTGAAVYFESGIENDNRIFFKVYGEKIGNKKYKPVTEVLTKPQETEVEGPVQTDATKYRKVIVNEGYPAQSVKTYLEVYEGGQLASKKVVRKSNYKGKKETIKYEKIPEPVVMEELPRREIEPIPYLGGT